MSDLSDAAENVDQLPALAAEFVRMNVDIIVAVSSTMVKQKSFRRGPPSQQGGSADDPAGAAWHARRSESATDWVNVGPHRRGDDSDRDGTECVRALRGRAPPPAG